MRIKKLHIYGFGKFQDVQIQLRDEPIQTFLGNNEAGKSTIMAFIRAVLFGFPTRQQSELRYEPKQGGSYGGSIDLQLNKCKIVKVERIAGKARGIVTVYYADGTVGGEDELIKLLAGMDRTIFTGIYSFGLTELQSMEQLKSDELNRYMYGAGMAGKNTLLDVERNTDKQLQHLYKPSGRNPIINTMVKKINETEESLLDWQMKLKQHGELVEEKKLLKKDLVEYAEKKYELTEKIRYYQLLQTIKPLVLKSMSIHHRLLQLPNNLHFPEDGQKRLDELKGRQLDVRAELNDINKKMTVIEEELESIEVNDYLDEIVTRVARLKENRSLFETKKEEKASLLQALQFEEMELVRLYDKLGLKNVQFELTDTSFMAEKRLTEIHDRWENNNQNYQQQIKQLEQLKHSIAQKEEQITNEKEYLLQNEARATLEKRVQSEQEKQFTNLKIDNINASIEQINQQIKNNTNPWWILFVSILIIVVSLSYWIIHKQWLPWGGIFALGFITLLIFSKEFRARKRHLKQLYKQKKDLLTKKEELQNTESTNSKINIQEAAKQLKEDDQRRNNIFLKEVQLREENEELNKLIQRVDTIENERQQLLNKVSKWATEHHYPLGFETSDYLKMFTIIEAVKKKNRQIDHINEQLTKITAFLEEEEAELNDCYRTYVNGNISSYYHEKIGKLTTFIAEQQENDRHLQNLLAKQLELTDLKVAAQEKLREIEYEIAALFNKAGVDHEEEFRRKGKTKEDYDRLKEEKHQITSQIMPLIKEGQSIKQLQEHVVQLRERIEDDIAAMEEELKIILKNEQTIHEKIAHITYQIKELEEGGSYSFILHQFENEKDQLKMHVKKWATFRIIKLIIDEAKSVYERDRQPVVIKEATKLFSMMTANRFTKLLTPIGEQKIVVERMDGFRFEIDELSQGTKEQLYLSLRLALATVHSKEHFYPIFIDDIFVNFDEERRLRTFKLLKVLSKKHQIIYFTCHPSMAHDMTDNTITLE